MGKIVIPYKPRDLQLDFHNERKRWSLLVCHRRFGKTVCAINELVKRALQCNEERPRFAYIAPYYRQAKQLAWDYLKHYTRVIPETKYNEAELRCDFPNGARITLFGGDNPDSVRGVYLDGVILDEYGDMSPRLFTEVIRPALSDRKGWALFIGSAKGGTIFQDLYDKVKDDKDWYVKVYKASETNLIDSKELIDARKIMDEDEYNQEYECSWTASIKGAYYAKELVEAEKEERITHIPYEQGFPVHTFWDLGVGDSTTIWFMQAIHNEIRFIDYYEMDGEGLPHYAKVLTSKGYVYGDHYAPHDIQVRELGSGVSRIQTSKNLGINFKIAPNLGVDDGISATRLIFNKCWFDKVKCDLGLKALRNYHKEYDIKKKQFKAQPRHDWASHGADAFRYFAVSWKQQRKATVLKRPKVAIC